MKATNARRRPQVTELAGRLFGGGGGTVYALLLVIFAAIFVVNASFLEPASLMAFVKMAAPIVLLAIGQYFVIVSGELDLSVGSLVGAQVVIAARLIDGEEGRTVPVLLLMLAFGVLVGLVNGLITTILKVQSLITTLGMMLVLYGAIRLWTGGAPTGALSEAFRQPGRGGIDMPVVRQLPWAVIILAVFMVLAIMLMRSSYGKTLMATGDNERTATFSGARVWQVRTAAFVLSSVMATFAAVLIGGFAGVTAQVGEGLEFTAITAVVLGGVVLGGGRGTVVGAMGGALALQALFTLFNQLALPATIRPAAQGLIIIAAVAYAARERSRPAAAMERSDVSTEPEDHPRDSQKQTTT
ncbi:ABC transporter permease [Actinobacteria bacterium YIM 96077]|uniref:ABC transporter permease n=1 Tax=Phytoactinopolyspora halophila TaxID=1981511 RepID=A0A329QCB5_9ACTN|nr:ABC transporter permease [Phytoactinopolyspora halophila]AYY14128.1 ABC transporter permease [Actinobacteria bacterium YIM 96077]RAW09996.1 ABC transporter permease [Phytoactinopolyspora halophila]